MKKIFAVVMMFAAVSMVGCCGNCKKKAAEAEGCCEKTECCEKCCEAEGCCEEGCCEAAPECCEAAAEAVAE